MSELHVHLQHEPDASARHCLTAALDPRIRLTTGLEPPDPAVYEILVAGRPEARLLDASPRLRTLVIPWAGLPETTRALLLQRPDLAAHNLHHNAAPTAELAMALLLAAAKRLVPMDRALRSGDWTPRYAPNPSLLLEGARALVLGHGAIGSRVAAACRSLGMHATGVGRRARDSTAGEAVPVFGAEALTDLLPEADALLICLPLTPETRGLIGRDELALLPREAILVNVGRGPIVEEEALYDALSGGRLRGAGLDVWYAYPDDAESREHTPPSRYPFGELENVVLSPHRGGHVDHDQTERLRMHALAATLNAAASGAPLPSPVDVRLGY